MVIGFKFRSFVLITSLVAVLSQAQSSSIIDTNAPKTLTTVPLLLDRSRASISVLIDGKGPYRLDIDTGFAGEALISKSVVDQLLLNPTGARSINDPSGANGSTASTYMLSAIRIGSLSIHSVEASEDLPVAGPGVRRDGVLGIAFFQKYLLTLDYPRQLLSLAVGNLKSAPPSEVLPFRLDHGIPTIMLTLGKRTIEAHVDSGGMGLSVPAGIAKDLPLDGMPIALGRVRTASNEIEITGARLTEDAHVAKYTFVKPFIEINPAFPTATFGAIPLSKFRITVDQGSQRIRLQSNAETIELNAPRRRPTVPISR